MPGKYDSPRDELLHRIVLDGRADDTVGDVQTWGQIYDGLSGLPRQSIQDDFGDVLDELGLSAEAFPDGASWIVCENSDGLISVDEFATEADYQEAINALENDYAEFEDPVVS